MLTEHVPDVLAAIPAEGVVRLLPAFDPWVVGANRERRARPGPVLPALDPVHRARIYRLKGWVSPVLLINGRLAGVWKHQRKGRQLHVEIEPFAKLPPGRADISRSRPSASPLFSAAA